METPKTHRDIEPDKDGMKEVGEIGGLARVAASGEPPEGAAKEELLDAAHADDEGHKVEETDPKDASDLDRGAL